MTDLKNQRLLRALRRHPVDRTPVWLMRQAGRYLPEYQATRSRAGDFMTLCTTPELACEVTLQPLSRFPLDAAILFSDILTIPHAMGLGLSITDGDGPRFKHPLRSERAIRALGVPDPEKELRYVMDTIRLVRQELDRRVPLIGFAGSPWTLATYMVEGHASKDFRQVKGLAYEQPNVMHRLLEILANAVARCLNAQVAAGAEVVMIFDTWGGVLTTSGYLDFSLAYSRRVIQRLNTNNKNSAVPVILFTKGGGAWLDAMADSGCDAIGLDWTLDIGAARQRVGQHVALQGNMDPMILLASPDRIREEVKAILGSYGQGAGHIFNLGHGVLAETKPEHVEVLIQAIHELSPAYHA
ncbi:MAG: uroporphyrinogen decarboxylase [Gammaproteobacteria bacterium]|nr:uroporphyrinogen decarboxylase [Gammaproteobacteria bacterium]MCI0591549.1 uroporphyrinogen decarboxylase [Gammaproteobacteria bacterium]